MRPHERKADRAREMLDRYEAGATLQELANDGGIHTTRAGSICHQESRRRVMEHFGVTTPGDVRDAWEAVQRKHRASLARRKEEKTDVRTL